MPLIGDGTDGIYDHVGMEKGRMEKGTGVFFRKRPPSPFVRPFVRPFATTDEVRIVLDMPNAEKTDGVVGAIIPADKTTDASELLGSLRDGLAVTIESGESVGAF